MGRRRRVLVWAAAALAAVALVVVIVVVVYPAVEMWRLRRVIQWKENVSSARAIRRLVAKGAKGVPILFDEAATGLPGSTIDLGRRERDGVIEVGRAALPYLRGQLDADDWRRQLNAAYCIARIAPEEAAARAALVRLASDRGEMVQMHTMLTAQMLDAAAYPWRTDVFQAAFDHGEGAVKARARELLDADGQPPAETSAEPPAE